MKSYNFFEVFKAIKSYLIGKLLHANEYKKKTFKDDDKNEKKSVDIILSTEVGSFEEKIESNRRIETESTGIIKTIHKQQSDNKPLDHQVESTTENIRKSKYNEFWDNSQIEEKTVANESELRDTLGVSFFETYNSGQYEVAERIKSDTLKDDIEQDEYTEVVKQNLTREEKSPLYQDTKTIQIQNIDEHYLRYIRQIPETDSFAVLYNRINRDFLKADLLCELGFNDDEFKQLCLYIKQRFKQIKEKVGKPIIDVIFSVAVVQVGIRCYDNNFWSRFESMLQLERLTITQRNWIGDTVTNTLRAFGKPIYKQNEYVTNILMHGFIVDSYASRFFDFLFQYYNIDLQRDISGFDEEDLNDLCYSIKNPFGKRKQLLSNYTEMSVKGAEDYCKKIISQSLNLIDMSFWNEFTSAEQLSGRYLDRFNKWINESKIFKAEQNKIENERITGKRIKAYRKSHLECNLEKSVFEVVLPSQMIRISEEDKLPKVFWLISSKNGLNEYNCVIQDSYSGYKTNELRFTISPDDTFDEIKFLLYKDTQVIKQFIWDNRKINFFDENGHWTAGEHLNEGHAYAFAKVGTAVASNALLAKRKRSGLEFLEFSLHKGDIIRVEGENNYYIGTIPEVGLTREFAFEDIFALDSNGVKYDVYHKLPVFVVDVQKEKLKGTAIIINGEVSRLSESKFIDIKSGRKDDKEYYFIDLRQFKNIKAGYNQIIIDFPDSNRRLAGKFVYAPDFEYSFEDAPYVFNQRGTLKINRNIEKEAITDSVAHPAEYHDFDLGELSDGLLILSAFIGNDKTKLCFKVPVLFYSFDNMTWSLYRPSDFWHSDFPSVFYIRYPGSKLYIGIASSDNNDAVFSYNKSRENVFACDITKMMTYFYDGRKISILKLIKENGTDILFRILMKSHVRNVTLEIDYEKELLTWKCDILGENVYFADVCCNDEVLLEKGEIVDGILTAAVPIYSAKYMIKIYETDAESVFDDDYAFVADFENSILCPSDLTDCCMKVSSIRRVGRETRHLEIEKDFYIFITEHDKASDNNKCNYFGIMVENFYKDNAAHASEVSIYIPDLNNINQVYVSFIDEYGDNSAFLYDEKTKSIVEEEYQNISKSEAYRRYETLDIDEYIWDVQFVEINENLRESGKNLLEKRVKSTNKSIWKN